MKRFFLFFLVLGLFVSVPVFAGEFTTGELGLYDDSFEIPPLPVSPDDDYPYYMVYYNTYYINQTWNVCYFDTVDGLALDHVDFESSTNNAFSLIGDDGDSISSYNTRSYKLVDGEWVFFHDQLLDDSGLYRICGTAINASNFSFVCGDHTVVANPISGGVKTILQSHLPRLPQTIMQAGSAVLSKALLISAILLVIGLIPRLIRSWAH